MSTQPIEKNIMLQICNNDDATPISQKIIKNNECNYNKIKNQLKGYCQTYQ